MHKKPSEESKPFFNKTKTDSSQSVSTVESVPLANLSYSPKEIEAEEEEILRIFGNEESENKIKVEPGIDFDHGT